MHQIPDDQLIRQLQSGSSAAFTRLYERYKDAIYAYCLRLLKDTDSAEDATQETFFKILRETASLHNPESFRGWLFRIARNEAYTILRPTRFVAPTNDENVWENISDGETLLDEIIATEQRDLIQTILGELKVEYREVLILREYQGLSYAEIAEITGDTESSVKSRLFKARKALSKKLAPLLNRGNAL